MSSNILTYEQEFSTYKNSIGKLISEMRAKGNKNYFLREQYKKALEHVPENEDIVNLAQAKDIYGNLSFIFKTLSP